MTLRMLEKWGVVTEQSGTLGYACEAWVLFPAEVERHETNAHLHTVPQASEERRRGTRLITPPVEMCECSAAPPTHEEPCWDASRKEMLRKWGERSANEKYSRKWRQILNPTPAAASLETVTMVTSAITGDFK